MGAEGLEQGMRFYYPSDPEGVSEVARSHGGLRLPATVLLPHLPDLPSPPAALHPSLPPPSFPTPETQPPGNRATVWAASPSRHSGTQAPRHPGT